MAFSQILINSLIAGSIYSLVAVGFSLMYSVTKFMNFAHGGTITLSAYFLYTFYVQLGFGLPSSILIVMMLSSIVGFGLNNVFKLFRKKKASSAILLIVSLAIFTFIENLMAAVYGTATKRIAGEVTTFSLFNANITSIQITAILTSFLALVLVWFFMKKTKLGKAMRAVSDNKEVAETVGIDAERVFAYSFIIASALASLAASFTALDLSVWPQLGFILIIKGFIGAVIGGINSVPGAILGSFLVGLSENFGIMFLPGSYKEAISFVLLFLFLLFRPNGILGIKRGVKQ